MDRKKKLKIQPDKVRLRTDSELERLPARFMEVPVLNWQDEAMSEAEDSDSEIEEEYELTGVWRTVPVWHTTTDGQDTDFDFTGTWTESRVPGLSSSTKVLLNLKKSKSTEGRLESFVGKSYQFTIGTDDSAQEAVEGDQKLPIYRPWWDKDPMPGIEKPRFIWQVESETDLTTNRRIKLVKFQDNSVFETVFRVLRKNQTDYIDVEEVEEKPEEIQDLLSLDVLETIRPLFDEGPLSREEYRKAISDALRLSDDPHAFPQCLDDLFTKIDTFAVDKLAWDDLCDFLQQQFAEKAETDYSSPPVALFPPCSYHETPHRTPISRAFTLADKGLMCFSEDGIISLWTSSFKPRIWRALGRSVNDKSNISDKKSSKWFTDMVYLPRLSKFVVPTGERELQFYDTATYDPYCQVTNLFSVPIHIDAKLTPQLQLIIVMGDISGFVTALIIDQAISTLRHWSQQRRVSSIPSISISDAVGELHGVKYVKFKVHDDMISNIYYCLSMNRVVTSSISQARSLIMGNLVTTWNANEMMEAMSTNFIEGVSDLTAKPKRRKTNDETIFPISNGCRTFDIWEEKRWLAAGGLDRLVWVWNMYVPSQPVAKLKGHNAAIFKVIFDVRSETLFSICTEKTIRVWQLLTNTCIHALDVKANKLRGPLLTCFYPSTDGILIQTNDDCNFLRITRSGDTQKEEGTTHVDGITAIIYNPQHEFVVTCSSEDILVWECETGKLVAEFNTIGGDGSMHLDTIAEKKEKPMEEENIFIMPQPLIHGREQVDTYEVGTVTCVTLDNMGRRFFTAHANGVIKAWNFYNGRNLYNLYKPLDNNLICDMHYVTINSEHRYLITVGWDRRVVVYIDTQGPEVVHQLLLPDEPIEFTHPELGHEDDIWACTFGFPNLIASGDYSGRLIVWNINSGHIVGYLRPNGPRDKQFVKDKFITSLIFHSHTNTKGTKNTYLISSGPYHLIHIWRANTTREINIGSVGWNRPCDQARDYVTCIKSIPENNLLVFADTWGCVSLWSVEDTLNDLEPTSWFTKKELRSGKDRSGFRPPGTHDISQKSRPTIVRGSSSVSIGSEGDISYEDSMMSQATKSRFVNVWDDESAVKDDSKSTQTQQVYTKFMLGDGSNWPSSNSDHGKTDSKSERSSQTGDSARSSLKNSNSSKKTAKLSLSTSQMQLSDAQIEAQRAMERMKRLKRAKGYGLGPVQVKFIRSWKCHVDGFAALEVCNTYGLIVTGSKDKSVRIWDFEGNFIGYFGQPEQWLIGDPTSYQITHPQDVMLDMKRIRGMDFFRRPKPAPLTEELSADKIVREMLQQAERPKMTDLDIQLRSGPYEYVLQFYHPTTLWIQADAPVGPYRRTLIDKTPAQIMYSEGKTPVRKRRKEGKIYSC